MLMIFYVLRRAHFVDDATGFNGWQALFSGREMFYEDRGLTLYTSYRYRITTHNNYGFVTSEPSEEVTTFGGRPRISPILYARVMNHTSTYVNWTKPG